MCRSLSHQGFDEKPSALVPANESRHKGNKQTSTRAEAIQVKCLLTDWEWNEVYIAAATPRWDAGCIMKHAPNELIGNGLQGMA